MFKARCRAGGAPSREESGGHDPQRSPARPFSGRGLPPGRFTLHFGSPGPPVMRTPRAQGGWRRTEIPTPSAFRRPCGFQPQPAPRPVHPPGAEGGALEAHGVNRASLSGRARPLAGSPSVRRAGLEPARLSALVPGTSVSACFHHQRIGLSRGRALDPFRLPTGQQGAAIPMPLLRTSG